MTSRNPIEAVREIAERGIRLGKLELELKTAELKGKAARFGIGAGLGLVAVLLAPLLVIFLLATIAAALATVLKVWLAILDRHRHPVRARRRPRRSRRGADAVRREERRRR